LAAWRIGRMVTDDSTSITDSALLQERLARLGKVMFLVAMSGVLFRGVVEASSGGFGQLIEPNFLWNLGGNLTFGALWLVCAGPPRSVQFVTHLENVCLFAACVAYSVMGATWHESLMASSPGASSQVLALSHDHISTLVLLVLTYALVIRAAMIPSTARRTRWLTGLLGIPLVVIATHGYEPTAEDASLLGQAVGTAVWWTFTVVICSVISSTIYGLRRKVIEARKLGQYTLEAKLGEGGMGLVYRASHAMLRRPTAIKLLRPGQGQAIDLARFEREVRMTARLSHPNTVTIYDYGRTQDDVFYYAMELLEGADLDSLVRHCGPQPPSRVVHILERVADALSEAHEIGLIHRDIKPSNIVLCARGGSLDVPKVVDFGLVRQVEEADEIPLTISGMVLGTPRYMSPEAIVQGESVDGRTDLYAVGAMGYYLLTGEHAIEGSTVMQLCWNQVHSKPIPPSDHLGHPLPGDLEQILLDCLAKEPGDRPDSAASLRDRLRACADVPRWTNQDAQEWWALHGDKLPGDRSNTDAFPAVAPSEARTILVDPSPAR